MAKEQNRILEKYKTEVVPALIKEFGLDSEEIANPLKNL